MTEPTRLYRFCASCAAYHNAAHDDLFCADCENRVTWRLDELIQRELIGEPVLVYPAYISPRFFALYESELARAQAARDGPSEQESAMPG